VSAADSTGVAALDTAAVWALAVTAVVGLGAVLWRVARRLRELARRVEDFIDDWVGVPGRPGVEQRPGVMERLDRIERTVGIVAHEVRPNGGSSMRDAVDRVDSRTASLTRDSDQD
jgi:hypothetical protein